LPRGKGRQRPPLRKGGNKMTAAELKKKLSGSLATGLSIKTLGR
jgi:hypothetical protein